MENTQTQNKNFQIGELSERFGVSQRTLRYYEELGLIHAVRTEGGFRIYDATQVERLETVLTLKDLGMALDEISELLKLKKSETNDKSTISALHKNLLCKRDEFLKKIELYKKGIDELNQLISLLDNCRECSNPQDQCKCEQCLSEQGDQVSPLIKTLL